MATETVITRSTSHFVDHEPRSIFSTVLRETALLHGEGKVTPFANVHEVAYLRDAAYPSAFSLLREVAYLRGTALPMTRVDIDVRETALLRDAISSSVTSAGALRETAVILGRVVGNTTATLRETARLGDRIYFTGGAAALREVARLRDEIYGNTSVVVRESALLRDEIHQNVHASMVVREVGYLDDTAVLRIVSTAVLREVAALRSLATPFIIWSGDGANLREVFYFDDRATPPASGRAYTCSIDSWGLSEYANYPFLTQARNLAAGNNLWRLDALADYGAPIESWITTGKLDLGVAGGKRPAALYAAGSSSEPLGIVVTGDVDGVLMSYDYVMDLRDQRDYRNNKAILGKGFRSRYLQFRLGAPKYLGFRLLTAEVDLAGSQRRVG